MHLTGNTSELPGPLPTTLLEWRPEGLYCPVADLYIDPQRKVRRAIITHAHSDHARPGHTSYACQKDTVPLLHYRLGRKIKVEGFEYGKGFTENGVNISFHPSGHMTGAAMIRLEHRGEVWVITGDFKTEDDGFNMPWSPVPCHGLVMESTFALPIYRWRPQQEVAEDMGDWHKRNVQQGKVSVVYAYPLGKAQRLIHLFSSLGIETALHPIIAEATTAVKAAGIALPESQILRSDLQAEEIRDKVIILPASTGDNLLKTLGPFAAAMVSGWVRVKAMRSRQGTDMGFTLSDHACWDGLNQAVDSSGAEKVVVMHGYERPFAAWLRTRGREAWSAEELTTSEGSAIKGDKVTGRKDSE
jgi:putative mRNA 3-end processing factor